MGLSQLKGKNKPAYQDCRQVVQQVEIGGHMQPVITTECNQNGQWKTRFVTDGNGNPLPEAAVSPLPAVTEPHSAHERLMKTQPQTSFTASQPIYVPQE